MILFSLLFSIVSNQAQAFPEMVRHGYVNCQTCHVSPNGGGILNDYGRELSREVLAIWKSDSESSKEHLSAYGAMKDTPIENWLKLGGDSRSLYLYRNDSQKKLGRTLIMQGQLEAAVTVGQGKGKVTLVGSLDYQESLDFFSIRHYALYGIQEGLQIRVGKFIPAYGINTADHITLTRSGIRMGPMYESYNAELSYYPNEKTEVFLTGIFGNLSTQTTAATESGAAIQTAYSFSESNKFGFNIFRGSDSLRKRWLFGPYGMLGLGSQWTLMSEVDFQNIEAKTSQFGVMTTQKISFEPTDGIWTFFFHEFGDSDFKSRLTQSQVYGLGAQIFPRSHFELNLAWEKVQKDSFSPDFYDYFWFVAHFYI